MATMTNTHSRRTLLLMLLGLTPGGLSAGGITGITRLQKLLFLLEREWNTSADSVEEFKFVPYKKGPFSRDVYDDLELLQNLGLIESEITGRATDEETIEINALSYEDLIDDSTAPSRGRTFGSQPASDSYDERRFRLTDEGLKKVRELVGDKKLRHTVEGIRKIKSKYANLSLQDLLHYVYTQYPDMTTASDIKQKVLRNRRGRSSI